MLGNTASNFLYIFFGGTSLEAAIVLSSIQWEYTLFYHICLYTKTVLLKDIAAFGLDGGP